MPPPLRLLVVADDAVARAGLRALAEAAGFAVIGESAAEDLPAAAVDEAQGEPDRRTAVRFRQLLLDLGPTFIKLGQLLSSRPDLLPSHWIDELSQLQDSVPPIPLAEVRGEIERGLGRPVGELFAWLDDRPLASASIAQVHRARTHEGQEVVVKVQRPGTRQRIESDLPLLHYLATALDERSAADARHDVIEIQAKDIFPDWRPRRRDFQTDCQPAQPQRTMHLTKCASHI